MSLEMECSFGIGYSVYSPISPFCISYGCVSQSVDFMLFFTWLINCRVSVRVIKFCVEKLMLLFAESYALELGTRNQLRLTHLLFVNFTSSYCFTKVIKV
jgi:hypothetical protein